MAQETVPKPKFKMRPLLLLISILLLAFIGGIGVRIYRENAREEVNRQGWAGRETLYSAVVGGNVPLVKSLLAQGISPNPHRESGESPLFMAAICNKEEVAKVLIAAGADPAEEYHRPVHTDCNSVLGWATFSGNIKLVKLLLNAGAPPDGRDRKHNMALRHACQRGDLEMVKLLLARGARADMPVLYQHNLFVNTAAMDPKDNSPKKQQERAEIARLLLKHGADPFQQNVDGENALLIARRTKNYPLVKVLEDCYKYASARGTKNAGKQP